MQKFQDDPHVVYARAIVEKGSKVVCVEDGLPTWVAEVRAPKMSPPEETDRSACCKLVEKACPL